MAAGRQRAFDKEEALNKAMEVFWLKGFSGASLSDLTEAMGINKPSMYSAFGNKEQLYISAITHYVAENGTPHFDKLVAEGIDLKERLKTYLTAIAKTVSGEGLPKGCLVTASTCDVGSDSLPEDATQTIVNINNASKSTFNRFFGEEKNKGNIDADATPEMLSDYLLTTQFGLGVAARSGMDKNRLDHVIDQAVSCFYSKF